MKDIRNMDIQIGDTIAYPYQPYSGAGIRMKTGRVIKFNPKSVRVVELNPDGSDYTYTGYRDEEERTSEHNVIHPERKACIIGIVE